MLERYLFRSSQPRNSVTSLPGGPMLRSLALPSSSRIMKVGKTLMLKNLAKYSFWALSSADCLLRSGRSISSRTKFLDASSMKSRFERTLLSIFMQAPHQSEPVKLTRMDFPSDRAVSRACSKLTIQPSSATAVAQLTANAAANPAIASLG